VYVELNNMLHGESNEPQSKT